MTTSDNIKQARTLYNIGDWSEGYFDVNSQGHVVALPQRQGLSIDLAQLTEQLIKQGLRLPVLVRFSDILADRIQQLQAAFAQAMQSLDYQADYTAVYPIKVNQQRLLVESLLQAGGENVGLEAGSKPELLAVLGLSLKPNSVIICNGYKDREYIRLAMIARSLGHRVYLIIEKLGEIDLILKEAANFAVEPLLGVRVRLASIAAGKWQNSGGEKSKFGLTAAQILTLLEILQKHDKQTWLQLLHFHVGSQVPNIRDIQRALKEAARFYVELRQLDIPINCVDVGGGLGVDYSGTSSRDYCSTNYNMDEYAKVVVSAFAEICAQADVPLADIVSESGRALSAHHAVLITNTIDIERLQVTPIEVGSDEAHVLQELHAAYLRINARNAIEAHHEILYRFAEARSLFVHGIINLNERARAEQIYQNACLKIRDLLDGHSKPQRQLLDELNENLADKIFVNFSLFQSLPDVWAIDQLFPVLPLAGLTQALTRRAVIQDMTCDSDGRIDQYVDGMGVESTLPLPEQTKPYLLGFFMVGAYQETLGDIHNLFGDTDSVHVFSDGQGGYHISEVCQGDTVKQVLACVNFDSDALLQSYQQQLEKTALDTDTQHAYLDELAAGLQGYTYLED